MEEKKKIELTEEAQDEVSGGEYGDLLRPIMTTYKVICACGYQETVKSVRYGKVLCPQCKQLITYYEEGQGYR